ncbi:MAG: LLM class flavin-dependent oxidoreductase [Hyphomicrobiaceae bacterium]|nr:LLM class flavin-dependent oxidoreductase [Hyphomicrobiaceae bacterium]
MRFFNFHLMPYAAADLEAINANGSAWVTFPNSHYNPEIGADLYHGYLDQLEYADQLGYDGVCLNEHHQTAYGLMPIPGVLAGALARSVKRAKIAILGRALPLLNNPLMVAEEYAILDNLTRGRFIAGFVRGIGAEYHAMGVNPAESQARFHEAHDLIIRAWTEAGPFEHVGKHYHFRYVNPWPRPYQKPHPPIFTPSQGSTDTIRWSARNRYTYCQTLSPIAVVARFFDMYREEAEKAGYQATPDQLAWSNSIYVAETDEKAMREAKPHLEALQNRFLKMPIEMLLPPGYTSVESMKRIRAARVNVKPQTAEDLVKAGVVIVGSPNTVRERLAQYQELARFNTSLTKTQFGTMPLSQARENTEAVAREVLPYFQDKPTAVKEVAAQ